MRQIALFVIALTLLVGCGNKNSNRKNIVVSSLVGPSAISMTHLMDSFTVFENQTIDYRIYSDPLILRNEILKGETDIALVPTIMACNLINKGLDWKIAAIPLWGSLFLVGTDSTIRNFSDLKGKTVYQTTPGLTPDILFRYLLQKNGINPDKDLNINYNFPGHSDIANAMVAGKIELMVLSEPLVSMVMAKNLQVSKLIDLNSEFLKANNDKIPMALTALIVSDKLLANNKEWVLEFLELYKTEAQWVNNNHAEASKSIVAQNILPDTAVARKSIADCNINVVFAWDTTATIVSYLNLFYDLNPMYIGGKKASGNIIFDPNTTQDAK